ncbi:MAG: type III-A CRISPR-associated protein Cas10/Csm1 [Candidatus Marinimicrobia bacterium]|nr:type III-A CRISPR-associated protein Cas10/Csm1 [Candidatus Neomarinimicrobiota bacterium]
MKELRENLTIAALLHDIGKFYQRSEPNGKFSDSQFLSSNSKSIISDYCPDKGEYFSHKHSLWTYQFLSDNENKIYNNKLSDEKSVVNLAAKHHKPDTVLEEILQKSDWISAGMDRSASKDVKAEISQESKRKYNYRKQRLQPVFENVFRDDYDDSNSKRYKFTPLEINTDSFFPQDFRGEDRDLGDEYRENLWEGFIEEFKKLPRDSFNVFLESLLPLLQKYTWCIPGSTVDIPDNSLYDHLRSTAAIATCLFDYIVSQDKELIEKSKYDTRIVEKIFDSGDEKFATLICGDISGIQKFIYQITSKKALVSLKGRSFMVQLISDLAARYTIKSLGLPYTNLVYSSGGNFYILAPNTDKTKQTLNKVRNDLNQGILNRYHGRLYLAMGSTDLSSHDFLNNLSEKWDQVIKNSSRNKRLRFYHEMQDDPDFLEPFGPVENVINCSICGNDINEEAAHKIGDDTKICESCNELIRLGQKLRDSEYLVETLGNEADIFPIPGINIGYDVCKQDQVDNCVDRYSPNEFTKVYRFNNTDFISGRSETRHNIAYDYKFYGGNNIPLKPNGQVATLSDFAGSGGDFSRLGVLRMDVDNLGSIFRFGFLNKSMNDRQSSENSDIYSLSRLSTLSSLMNIFFSGYINTITSKYDDTLLTIYSGGDDLFIVGRWDNIAECALEIKNKFNSYSCSHSDISISGGMVLSPLKFPIHRAAESSGEAEDAAKNYGFKGNQKNAFTILDKTINWSDLEVIKKITKDLCEAIDKKNLNKGILTRLRRIYSNYSSEKKIVNSNQDIEPQQRKEMIQYNKWRWRMVYDLNRYAETNKKHAGLINAIQDALLSGHQYKNEPIKENLQEYIDIPARWAELLLRTQD